MKISFLFLFAFLSLAQSRFVPENTVTQAREQMGTLLRCWEEIDQKIVLSEPKYTMCQHLSDGEKYYVGGVDMESDDYTNILAIFGNSVDSFAVLNVCLQEAFSFRGKHEQAAVSFRCICMRHGCNTPAPLVKFIETNKQVLNTHQK